MINFEKLNKTITIKGQPCQGIIQIQVNIYTLNIYQGGHSTYDIIVKYKTPNLTRERTPKHIHWVVDLLLKMQMEKNKTKLFLNKIKQYWESSAPLINNNFDTLKRLIESDFNKIYDSSLKQLNRYGEYDIEFLSILFILLIKQEKTNYNQAFMFKNVIDKLLEENTDIYSIVGAATHNGS